MRYLLMIALFYLVALFCNHITEGFQLARLKDAPSLQMLNQGDLALAKEILDQPFYYLGKGGQVFAFVSQDGQHVLKFFKNTPHPLVPWASYKAKKKQKLIRDVTSYQLAFSRLVDETGLIFLHAAAGDHIDLTAHLVDKLGIKHKLQLHDTLFVLQKKGEPLASYIKHVSDKKAAIAMVLDLIKQREKEGIFDLDPALHRNIGFIEGEPFFLDPGRFVLEERDPNKPLPPKFVRWLYSEDVL